MNYPDLQIDWLRAFVAVVDAGSLSGAAPLVHRSQSAVSMQIKKLEGALGRPVLLRGPRHLELTPLGQELLAYARRMLELQARKKALADGLLGRDDGAALTKFSAPELHLLLAPLREDAEAFEPPA